MLLGADTGFFVAYANKHPRALEVWQEFLDGQHTFLVSTLSITEIIVYFLQRGRSKEAEAWLELLGTTDEIELIPVSEAVAAQAARYRHGLGLSTVDSVILASFLMYECDKMLTTDADFQVVEDQQLLSVEILTRTQ